MSVDHISSAVVQFVVGVVSHHFLARVVPSKASRPTVYNDLAVAFDDGIVISPLFGCLTFRKHLVEFAVVASASEYLSIYVSYPETSIG